MTTRKPVVLAVGLLCSCALIAAGCGSGTEASPTTTITAAPITTEQPMASMTTQATGATQPASGTQSAEDPTGDVQDGNYESPEGELATVGDIEAVRLDLESQNLVLQIRTVDDLPTALPAGIDYLLFVSEIWMDENTGYYLYVELTSDGWTAHINEDTGEQTNLDGKPLVVDNAISKAFPLAEMPSFAPSFEWRVASEWSAGIDRFNDYAPDQGEDFLHPTMLQFPPS